MNDELEMMGQIIGKVQENKPLIHCITNPISIHDCANIILAAGGRPIMAEHPEEVAQIVETANALALNLGNITDSRRQSIFIAGNRAMDLGIPVILDLVGIGCSDLRLALARQFLVLREKKLNACLILKGNISEIKTLAGFCTKVSGVDANPCDGLTAKTEDEIASMLRDLACTYNCVVLATGKIDAIVHNHQVYFVDNGSSYLAKITGTGCMLTVLTASYMSQAKAFSAALTAAVVFGICGERAEVGSRGTGSFQVNLLDQLSEFQPEWISLYARIRKGREG